MVKIPESYYDKHYEEQIKRQKRSLIAIYNKKGLSELIDVAAESYAYWNTEYQKLKHILNGRKLNETEY